MCDSVATLRLTALFWEETTMVTLFWCALTAMIVLLAARWVVPAVAPDTFVARILTRFVALELDEDSDEDVPSTT